MPLTNEQKEKVKTMRLDGYGYVSIANEIKASRDQVRDYCRTKNVSLFGERVELGRASCKYCTKSFQPKNSGQKYCSGECRNKAGYKLSQKKAKDIQYCCVQCGKAVKSGKQKYCSEICKLAYNTITKQCTVCNRDFKTTFRSKKYCSSGCMGEHRVERLGKRITKNCIQCGKEFITTEKKDGQFCSHSCSYTNQRKSHSQFAKELYETYSGMIVPLEMYKTLTTEIEYKCLKCGTVGKKKAGNLIGKYKKGCGACHGFIGKDSKGTIIIETFLKQQGMEYKREYGFDGLKMKNPLLYDFALMKGDSVEVLIEYDGRQHFEPVEKWGGIEELERIRMSDNLKNQYAKDNSIPLIRIKYNCEDIEAELERKLKEII